MSAEDKTTGNALFDAMLSQLVESGEAEQMEGLNLDELRSAMSAPGAADTVMAMQALGANSQAAVGQPAPDFELPVLATAGEATGERIRLSERLVNRPVALIFGSYT